MNPRDLAIIDNLSNQEISYQKFVAFFIQNFLLSPLFTFLKDEHPSKRF